MKDELKTSGKKLVLVQDEHDTSILSIFKMDCFKKKAKKWSKQGWTIGVADANKEMTAALQRHMEFKLWKNASDVNSESIFHN